MDTRTQAMGTMVRGKKDRGLGEGQPLNPEKGGKRTELQLSKKSAKRGVTKRENHNGEQGRAETQVQFEA